MDISAKSWTWVSPSAKRNGPPVMLRGALTFSSTTAFCNHSQRPTTPHHALRKFVHETGHAARINLVPGVILQAIAASLLAAYYLAPSARPVFEWFATQKQTPGYGYSAIAINGGLVPFLYLWLRGSIKTNVVKTLLIYVLYWRFFGVQIDAFYHIQNALFSEANDLATIATKVAVDQLILTPFWTIPRTAVAYL